jgi:hypothetical protein
MINASVQEEEKSTTPNYIEPYPGYLEANGFAKRNASILCDRADYWGREIKFEMVSLVPEIYNFSQSINSSHNRYFNFPKVKNIRFMATFQEEPKDQDLKQFYEELRSEGIQVCGGYFVTFSTFGNRILCSLEDSVFGKNRAKLLERWLIDQERIVYDQVGAIKYSLLNYKVNRLLPDLNKRFLENMPSGFDPEDLDYIKPEDKEYEQIVAPIREWLVKFKKAYTSSGMMDSDLTIMRRIQEHYQQEGLEHHCELDFDQNLTDKTLRHFADCLR